MAQVRRWLPFAAAALTTLLLAGGFGLAASELATPRPQPDPQLKTVPAATLARLGIELSAPAQPVYCGLAGAAVSHGWLRAGSAGCAIGQSAAESAARQGGTSQVLESVLARVTSNHIAPIGRDHLAWVVVIQQPAGSCPARTTGLAICPGGGQAFAWTQLVMVDARGAGVLNRLRLIPAGGRVLPRFPPGAMLGSG